MPERNLSRDKITRYLEEGDVLPDHAPSWPWSLADVRATDGQWEERGLRPARGCGQLALGSRLTRVTCSKYDNHAPRVSFLSEYSESREERALLFRSFKFKHLSVWIWLLKGSDKQWVCDDGDSTHSLHSRPWPLACVVTGHQATGNHARHFPSLATVLRAERLRDDKYYPAHAATHYHDIRT